MSWATATGIAYPRSGSSSSSRIARSRFAGHRHVAPSVWLAAAAFTVSALTDASYTYLASLNDYVTGDWLNLGWQAEAVLLALAGLSALRHQEGDGTVVALGKDLAMVPVLARRRRRPRARGRRGAAARRRPVGARRRRPRRRRDSSCATCSRSATRAASPTASTPPCRSSSGWPSPTG